MTSAVTPVSSAQSCKRREAFKERRVTSPTTEASPLQRNPSSCRGQHVAVFPRLAIDDAVGMQSDTRKRWRKKIATAKAPEHGSGQALRTPRSGCPPKRPRQMRRGPEPPPTAGGGPDRTQSPAKFSAKWEYSRAWPETFANLRPEITDLGVWRRNRTRKKRGFPAQSRVSGET
jgi:hypothetical protein